MVNGAGEVLEGANGDVLLRRVAAGGVSLCYEWKDDLDVPLSPEGAAVQQGDMVVDAAAVHVHSYRRNS